MDVSDQCIFCGRNRFDERDCRNWNKKVQLYPNVVTASVCPECRKLFTVGELFERMRGEQSRYLKKGNLGGRV